MSDNLIKFKPKAATIAVSDGNHITDKEAWDNLGVLKNILRANIDALHDPDAAWFILSGSPFEFVNRPELLNFVCGYYKGRLEAVLNYLETPMVTESYLGSHLVNTLDVAMHLMQGDHLTRIQICTEDESTVLVLHRTYDVWGVVNLYVDGKSMHDAAVESLRTLHGKTDNDLFHWEVEATP